MIKGHNQILSREVTNMTHRGNSVKKSRKWRNLQVEGEAIGDRERNRREAMEEEHQNREPQGPSKRTKFQAAVVFHVTRHHGY